MNNRNANSVFCCRLNVSHLRARAEAGNTLLSVLLALGISGVVMAVMMAMTSNQTKMQRMLAQKYELFDLKSSLSAALLSQATCKQVMTSFNYTVVKGPDGYGVVDILSLAIGSSAPIVKVVGGQPTDLPGSLTGLKIRNIQFKIDDQLAGDPNQFIGHFSIQPDAGPSGMALAPIIIRQIVKTDAAKKIVDCVSTTIPTCPTGQVYSGLDSNNLPVCMAFSGSCPAGKVLNGRNSDGSPICVDGAKISNNPVNVSCPSGQAMSGVNSAGQPVCMSVTSGAPPPSSTPTSAGTCSGGSEMIQAPDNSQNCFFSWDQTNAGIRVTTAAQTLRSTNGGTGSAVCGTDGVWTAVSYSCPSKEQGVCPGGINYVVKSVDNTNTCTFSWNQANADSSIQVTQATNGGSLTGTCTASGWAHNFNCPGTAIATCSGGSLQYQKCRFQWGPTIKGREAAITDTQGKGSASGWICVSPGIVDAEYSKGSVSGCD